MMKRLLAMILVCMLLASSTLSFAEEQPPLILGDTTEEEVVESNPVESSDASVGDDPVVTELDEFDLDQIVGGSAVPEDEDAPAAPEDGDAVPASVESCVAGVEIDDLTFTITWKPGALPEDATLTVEKAEPLSVDAEGDHFAWHISVLDGNGNPSMPDYEMELPVVTVSGLSGEARVFAWDPVGETAYEIDASVEEQGICFPFVDSTVYDVVITDSSENDGDDGSTDINDISERSDSDVPANTIDVPEGQDGDETVDQTDDETIDQSDDETIDQSDDEIANQSGDETEQIDNEPSEQTDYETKDQVGDVAEGQAGDDLADQSIDTPVDQASDDPEDQLSEDENSEDGDESVAGEQDQVDAQPAVTSENDVQSVDGLEENNDAQSGDDQEEKDTQPMDELEDNDDAQPMDDVEKNDDAQQAGDIATDDSVADGAEPGDSVADDATSEDTESNDTAADSAATDNATAENTEGDAAATDKADVDESDDQAQPSSDDQGQPSEDEQAQPANDEEGQPSDDEQAEPASDESTDEQEEESTQPVTVLFNTTPVDAIVTVYIDAEPIPAQEDGSFLLMPGEYTYSAEAEGFVAVESVPFTVEESDEPLIIDIILDPESVPFAQTVTVGGVEITVTADAGAFPAGSTLWAQRVSLRPVDEAVEEERDESQNVASSYTFDIRVYGPEGDELQPAEGFTVNVSFALAEVTDENLETSVYHITEEAGTLEAEKLEVNEIGDTATAESTGFSYYTVEFTYGELEYMLPGGESVALSEVLAELGLSGEVEAVKVSNSELFDAVLKDGVWMVESYQAFSSEEWMKVTINGVELEITVTDDQTVPTIWYKDAEVHPTTHAVSFTSKSCTDYTTINNSSVSWGSQNQETWWYAVTGNETITINERIYTSASCTINLILCDGAKLEAKNGINVPSSATLNIYAGSTVSENIQGTGVLVANGSVRAGIGSNTGSSGAIKINGGNISASSDAGGAGIGGRSGENSGPITINGGKVEASSDSGAGIGGGMQGSGEITINGGIVTATASTDGAGIGSGIHNNNSTITINGGTVTATSSRGTGIGGNTDNSGGSSGSTITINGGTVTATSNQGAGIGVSHFGNNNDTITIGGGSVLAECTNNGYKAFGGIPTLENNMALLCWNGTNFVSWNGTSIYNMQSKMLAEPSGGHKHKVEGTDVQFQPWSSTDSLPTEGSYYLLNDVYLSNSHIFSDGKTINLCLNGHRIILKESGDNSNSNADSSVLNITGKNITLNLFDEGTGCGTIQHEENGVDGDGVFVVNTCVFNMHGGTITGNGRGVTIFTGGTFTMTGGSITCNRKYGGVNNRGTFKMTGGSITNNHDQGYAGGVSNQVSSQDPIPVFNLSGHVDISGNTNTSGTSDVYLPDKVAINITGALSSAKKICVTMEKPGVFTSGYSYGSQNADHPNTIFASNATGLTVELAETEAALFTPWQKLQNDINYKTVETSGAYEGKTLITLEESVTAGGSDLALVVPENRDVVIDLNGKTIDRGLSSATANGNVITVQTGGTLTLTDTSSAKTGKITGGNNTFDSGGGVFVNGGTFIMNGGTISGNTAISSTSGGGGVFVYPSGAFTMNGGTISGNNSGTYGGGVYVSGGTFTMNDGRINDNTTSRYGGGVFVNVGTFIMNDGMISGNAAGPWGGGVCVIGNVVFTMKGGTIKDNTAMQNGGGVYVTSISTFNLSGAPQITGNKQGANIENGTPSGGVDNNVFLAKPITVTGSLTDQQSNKAKIGLTMGTPGVFTSGWNTYMPNGAPTDYFTSDDTSYAVRLTTDGEAQLFRPTLTASVKGLDAVDGFVNLDITLSDTTVNGTFGGVTFTAGQGATLPLYYDKPISAQNLPYNVDAALTVGDIDGITFVSWTEGDQIIATEKSVTLYGLTADRSLTANYSAIVPEYETQPQDLNLTYGYTSGNVLAVAAKPITGCDFSYQWYENTAKEYQGSTKLDGETSSSLTIPEGKSVSTTYYYCVVTAIRTADSKTTADKPSDIATVEVAQRPVTITAKDQTVELNAAITTGTGQATISDGTPLVSGHRLDSITLTADTGAVTTAGTITPSGAKIVDGNNQDMTGNYAPGYADGILTVTKGTPTGTVSATAITYGEALSKSTLSGSMKDAYKGTEVKGSFAWSAPSTKPSVADSGKTKYGVVFTPTEADKYKAVELEATLTVNPAGVTLTANSDSAAYDGKAHSVTGFTCSVAALTFDGVSASGIGTNAGVYEVAFAGATVGTTRDTTGNYVVSTLVPGKLTVKAITATVTVTGKTASVPYDGKAYSVSGYDVQISTPLYKKTDFTFSGTATASRIDAGKSAMGLASSQFTNTNANFSTVTFNVTDGWQEITPITATVTVTGNTNTATYDGKAHTVTGYTATASTDLYDVTKDFTFSGTGSASQTTVGKSAMGLTSGQFKNNSTNFSTVTFNVADGWQEITPATITITPDDKSSQFGKTLQNLTYQVGGAYVAGDDLSITLSTVATPSSDVGEYPITVAKWSNPNYTATLAEGKYTITKTDLAVTASGYSGVYDGKAHGITVTTTGTGVTIYYGSQALTAQNYATAGNTTPVTRTDTGTTTVYYYAVGNNYDAVSGSKTIEIRKATGTASEKPVATSLTYMGEAQALVKAPTTLPAGYTKVQYSIDGGKTWTDATPTATDAGTYTVQARFIGDANHNDFTVDPVTASIAKKAVTVTALDQQTPFKDSVDKATLEGAVKGHKLGKVTLTANSGVITPSAATIVDESGTDFTNQYTIEYVKGKLKATGEIIVEVEEKENVPPITVEGLTRALAELLATPEELARVAAGETLLLYLDIENKDATVSEADKALVTEAALSQSSLAKIAVYLDMTLKKQVGDAPATLVTDLKGNKIKIKITIPEEFRAPEGVKRTFFVVRIHDGVVEIIAWGTGDAIECETGLFSTYALVYVDEQEPEPQPRPAPSGMLIVTTAAVGDTSIQAEWTQPVGIDGVDLFMTPCGKDDFKLVASVPAPQTSYTFDNLPAEYGEKVYARAYVMEGDTKTYVLDQSPVTHCLTSGGNGQFVNPASITLKTKPEMTVKLGKKASIKAKVTGVKKGKVYRHDGLLRYISSDPSVARVSAKGKVSAVGPGSCTVYVLTTNGIWTTVKVNVDATPKSIKFGKVPKSISIGSTLNLGKRVVLNPTKAVTTLTWSSSKPEVATVDEKGRVTGVSKGKTTITVTTANGKKRKITIKVK